MVTLLMGLISGGLAAWATSEMGISIWAFLIVTASTCVILYRVNDSVRGVFGSGLYTIAFILPLVPLLFYLPNVFSFSETGSSAEEVGTFIGSLTGMIIWEVPFFIFALVIFGIGYFVRRSLN